MEQDNCPGKKSQQLTEHPKEEERTLSLLSFLSTQIDSKIFTLLSFLFDVRVDEGWSKNTQFDKILVFPTFIFTCECHCKTNINLHSELGAVSSQLRAHVGPEKMVNHRPPLAVVDPENPSLIYFQGCNSRTPFSRHPCLSSTK